MYRYLDKNVKRDSASLEDEDDELDMDWMRWWIHNAFHKDYVLDVSLFSFSR
jgi:hypothetical protein